MLPRGPLAALLLLLLLLSASSAQSPPPPKKCCAALATVPGFAAAATGPVAVPVLILTLPAPGLPDKKGVEAVGRLCECGVGEEAEGEGEEEADGGGGEEEEEEPWAEVRVRGSTSARDFTKKSFALTFTSPGQPEAASPRRPRSFLGMPGANGKFALLGVMDDRTLGARSSMTFDAFREGMGRWAPRTRRAELLVRVEAAPANAANAGPAAPAPAAAAVAASAELAPATPTTTTAATSPKTALPPTLQYRGVYLATERVTRNKQRVDVAAYKPGGPDPTGGFLIAYENDNVAPGEPVFATRMSRLTFVVEEPSARTIANASALAAAAGGGGAASSLASSPSPDPLVYLTNFFNGLERALLAPGPLVTMVETTEDEPNPRQQQTQENKKKEPRATIAALPHLAPFLDAAAAADYFLITELSKNPDGYRGSVKMHKDAGKPLFIGTPWDYGESYGTCCGFPLEGYRAGGRSGPGTSGGSAISPNGWRFNVCADPGRCVVEPADGTSQYFRRLWQDGAFRAGVARRWRALRAGALNDTFFAASIGRSASALASSGAAGRNNALWAAELPPRPEEMIVLERAGGGVVVSGAVAAAAAAPGAPLPAAAAPPPPPPQFAAANLALRQWVLARLAWMDEALAAVADPAAPADAYLAA